MSAWGIRKPLLPFFCLCLSCPVHLSLSDRLCFHSNMWLQAVNTIVCASVCVGFEFLFGCVREFVQYVWWCLVWFHNCLLNCNVSTWIFFKTFWGGCSGLNGGPLNRDVNVLIPRTLEYFHIRQEWTLPYMVKDIIALKSLRGGAYPGLSLKLYMQLCPSLEVYELRMLQKEGNTINPPLVRHVLWVSFVLVLTVFSDKCELSLTLPVQPAAHVYKWLPLAMEAIRSLELEQSILALRWDQINDPNLISTFPTNGKGSRELLPLGEVVKARSYVQVSKSPLKHIMRPNNEPVLISDF